MSEVLFIRALMICILYLATMGLIRLYKYIISKRVSIQAPVLTTTTAEDTTSQATIKRVRKAFKDQKQSIDAMAMKSHDQLCDVMGCSKDVCYIHTADKIVGTQTVSLKTIDERIKELSKSMPKKLSSGQKRAKAIRDDIRKNGNDYFKKDSK